MADFLFNEWRQAIQDIRQKVVEQGWFGRVTTPKPVVEMPFQTIETNSPTDPAQERRPSFEEQWAPKDRTEAPRDRAPEHDIER
jgi:hypothetical protein